MSRPRSAERIYGIVVSLYPRAFRERYGPALRLAFHDLLEDPMMPRWRIWLSVLADLHLSVLQEHRSNWVGGLSVKRDRLFSGVATRRGAVFGCLILLTWITFRSFHLFGGRDPSPEGWAAFRDVLRLLTPWLLFVPAGYVGARASGKFRGGIWAGLVAGAIAAVTIPGDYLVFHRMIPGGVAPVSLTLAGAATLALTFAAAGAALAMLNHGSGLSRWTLRLGQLSVAWQRPE